MKPMNFPHRRARRQADALTRRMKHVNTKGVLIHPWRGEDDLEKRPTVLREILALQTAAARAARGAS